MMLLSTFLIDPKALQEGNINTAVNSSQMVLKPWIKNEGM